MCLPNFVSVAVSGSREAVAVGVPERGVAGLIGI